MLGDSLKSIYVKKKYKDEIYLTLQSFLRLNLSKYLEQSRSWSVGYQVFGPFLVGFCQWLHQNVLSQKRKKIFFLSREGYIFQKSFQMMYSDIETSYLYVSRKSLALPSMYQDSSVDSILNSLVLSPSFTIKDLLKSLGFSFEQMRPIAESCNITEDMLFYRKDFKTDNRIQMFIKKIHSDILLNIQEQYNNFTTYLNQENFSSNVAIVDIGWHNSIQNYFNSIVNHKNVDIQGYYVGVYKDAIRFEKEHAANGFLYEYDKNSDIQYKTFAFVSLFESMFLSHEGTTLSYIEKNGRVEPLTASYEYDEHGEMFQVISDFQLGALAFIKDFLADNQMKNIIFSPEVSQANLFEFGLNPFLEDIEIFGNIHFENFTYNQMINYNHSCIYYLFHLKTLKNDFYKSGWRILFLKKLIFFPFPHFSFFRLLCKLFL